MPKPYLKRSDGFTLIECVVVLALLGIVTSLVSGFVVHSMAAYSRQSTNQMVQSDMRYALDYMVRELREAVSVIAIAENDSKVIYKTTLQGPLATQYFRLRGTAIQRHDNQPLSQYVQSMQFSYDDDTARVTIALQSVAIGNSEPYRLFTSVALRNALR